MQKNAGGAICGKGVVKLRLVTQLGDGLYIVHKDSPDIFERCPHSVDIHVLLRLAVRCPHPDYIALVGNDVYQLVLPEEAGNRRIALAPFLARLDRNRDVIFAPETEAQHNMRNGLTRPIHRDEVHGIELTEIVGPVFPAWSEVRFCPVIEISYAVDCNQVAVDLRIGRSRHLRLPIAVVGCRNKAPQGRHDPKRSHEK